MGTQIKKNHRYTVSWERFNKDYTKAKTYRKTLRNLQEAKNLSGWIESFRRTCCVQITHWWDGMGCSDFWEVIKPVW